MGKEEDEEETSVCAHMAGSALCCRPVAALGKGSFAPIPAATGNSCGLQITMSMGNPALKIGDRAQAFGEGGWGRRLLGWGEER